MRKHLNALPRMHQCERSDEGCPEDAELTWEHAFGRKEQREWQIICLCEYHHGVNKYQDRGDMNKELNQHIALQYATEGDFLAEPRKAEGSTGWRQKKKYLEGKYGQRTGEQVIEDDSLIYEAV